MKELLIALVVGLAFVLAAPPVMAQNTADGQIYSMTVQPDTPKVFDQITMSIGVTNPSSKPQSYRLEVLVTKDGNIVSSQPYTFDLQPGLGTFVSPTFVPKDIGQYQIVAKLSDSFNVEVKDLQIKNVNVVSEIGPFDIAIDAPSDTISPGTRTPLILTLANMGEKATDVQVEVTMDCTNQPNIDQQFFVFLYPGAIQNKQISTDTCHETGPHDLTASVIVFNKTWISAVTQVFLNESTIQLAFDLPEEIDVRAGESKVFDLKVTNAGNSPISNMKLLIPLVPTDWMTITPDSIVSVQPGQTVLFLVNITAPRDATDATTSIGISAAADQVLSRKTTTFKVLSFGEALPGQTQQQSSPAISVPTQLDLSSLLGGNNSIFLGVGVVAAVGGLVAAMRFRKKSEYKYRPRAENVERRAASEDKLRKVAQSLSKKRGR